MEQDHVAALGSKRDSYRPRYRVESSLQCATRLRVERDQLGRHLVPSVVELTFPMDRKADGGAVSPMMPSCSSLHCIHRAPLVAGRGCGVLDVHQLVLRADGTPDHGAASFRIIEIRGGERRVGRWATGRSLRANRRLEPARSVLGSRARQIAAPKRPIQEWYVRYLGLPVWRGNDG